MALEEILEQALSGKGEHDKATAWETFRGRLISQKIVCKLRGDVSNMTIFRHVRKNLIPPPIVIDGRNYWTLGEILDANEADSVRRR